MAEMSDYQEALAKAEAALRRWYEAASPYATPEALKEALASRPEAASRKAWSEMSPLERAAYNAGVEARSMTDEEVMRSQQKRIAELESRLPQEER